MRRSSDTSKIVLILLLIIAVVVGLYWAFTYEKELQIQVVGRWWKSYIEITYETSHPVTTSRTEQRCSGIGENEVCWNETVIKTTTETTTHTRCHDSQTGRKLPASKLDPPCKIHVGDSINGSITYHIEYRINETIDKDQAKIKLNQWERLKPGIRANIVLNIMNSVKEIK
jgi:hypothetical protein